MSLGASLSSNILSFMPVSLGYVLRLKSVSGRVRTVLRLFVLRWWLWLLVQFTVSAPLLRGAVVSLLLSRSHAHCCTRSCCEPWHTLLRWILRQSSIFLLVISQIPIRSILMHKVRYTFNVVLIFLPPFPEVFQIVFVRSDLSSVFICYAPEIGWIWDLWGLGWVFPLLTRWPFPQMCFNFFRYIIVQRSP